MLPDEVMLEPQPCHNDYGSKTSKPANGACQKSNEITKEINGLMNENNPITTQQSNGDIRSNSKKLKIDQYYFGQPLIWKHIIAIGLFHVIAVYSWLTFPYIERYKTTIWTWVVAVTASFGVGAGAHRLWTHRSYKATMPLRIILLCCYSIAGMNSLYNWVRDHRVHHKYSETDADPHNSSRGFFFSHVGWLLMKKHPEVKKKGRQIDMSDITSDPVIAFEEKYFLPLKIFFCFLAPTVVPVYFWNEDWYYAITSQIFMRYSFVLNATWCVNSVAHIYGWRPYDRQIAPTENGLISWWTGGEGWHNYHHTFPWDYMAAESFHIGLDLSTMFIHTFNWLGWAYDLKRPSPDLVKNVVLKKGDGTHNEIPPPIDDTKES